MKDVIDIYNKKNSFFVKKTNFLPKVEHLIQTIDIAIVIPACNEFPTLFETLNSVHDSYTIARSKNSSLPIVGYIVVVNNKHSSTLQVKENNQLLLQKLSSFKFDSCSIITIDLTQKGTNLPEKQGVGYARKYGMDFALLCHSTVIACMDADTLVDSNYIQELISFFNQCVIAKENKKQIPVGAVTNFIHQKNTDKSIQSIVNDYERYMKTHSEKLKHCGTPFWLWALGPTIVSSSYGYAGSAGMNKRIAGEDFYFLQSLVKLHIQQNNNGFSKADIKNALDFPILNCTVYPQSRYSDRVLFGTGKKLFDVKQGKDKIEFYEEELYTSLKVFLELISKGKGNPETTFPKIKDTLPEIWLFLDSEGFFSMWEDLYRQNKKSDKRVFSAFHSWFDGLKILRLIHVLGRKDTT